MPISRSKTILLEVVPYIAIAACNVYIVLKLRKANRILGGTEEAEMVYTQRVGQFFSESMLIL